MVSSDPDEEVFGKQSGSRQHVLTRFLAETPGPRMVSLVEYFLLHLKDASLDNSFILISGCTEGIRLTIYFSCATDVPLSLSTPSANISEAFSRDIRTRKFFCHIRRGKFAVYHFEKALTL